MQFEVLGNLRWILCYNMLMAQCTKKLNGIRERTGENK